MNEARCIFIDRPLDFADVASLIKCSDTSGAHATFMGQVRADYVDEKVVKAIEYSCYIEMASAQLRQLCAEAIKIHNLIDASVRHSLGVVHVGQISLIVVVSARHRAEAFSGLSWIVDKIKSDIPIWGKETFEDDSTRWKSSVADLKS